MECGYQASWIDAAHTGITIQTKNKQMSNTPASVMVGYAHDRSGFGISVGYGGASISFSGTRLDEAKHLITWTATP